MANNEQITESADGYSAEAKEQAQKAKKEFEGVRYIKARLDFNDSNKVLLIYNKIIDNKMFETQVGLDFLLETQEFLRKAQEIDQTKIKPIPADFLSDKTSKDVKEQIEKVRQVSAPETEKKPVKIERQQTKKERKKGKEKKKTKPQKRTANKTKKEDGGKWQERFKISLIINLMLVAVIIVLFWISTTTDHPNILNYENEVIDKYEHWEEELTEREETVREYEKKYNIQQ